MVVVNQQNDVDEESAQYLSEPDVPIVVIDSRTLAGLQRLGAASPVAESRLLFEPEDQSRKTINPLLKSAEAKLRSAEILLEQQCTAGVDGFAGIIHVSHGCRHCRASPGSGSGYCGLVIVQRSLAATAINPGTGGGDCAGLVFKPESGCAR